MANDGRTSDQPVDPDTVSTELLTRFEAGSRAPFRQMLANLMSAQPDAQALKAWAVKSPDRWSQAVAIAGRLSGYADKHEIEAPSTLAGLVAAVSKMSDGELLEKLAALRERTPTAPPLFADNGALLEPSGPRAT